MHVCDYQIETMLNDWQNVDIWLTIFVFITWLMHTYWTFAFFGRVFDRCFRCWIIQKRLIVFNSHCIRYIWIKTLFINRFSGSIETWERIERQANRYTNGQPETIGIELKRYFQHYVNITYSCTSCDKIAVCFCTRQAYRLAVVSVGRKATRYVTSGKIVSC